MPDHRYLQRRREGWYVRIRVPQDLVAVLGRTHVVRSLQTKESSAARAKRWLVLGQLHSQFDAIRASGADAPALASPAAPVPETMRAPLCHTPPPRPLSTCDERRSAGESRQRRSVQRLRPTGSERRLAVAAPAPSPIAAPSLENLSESWLREVGPTITKQTISQHRVALRELFAFVDAGTSPPDLQRRTAGAFITERLLPSDRSRKTVNRLISSLSAFWTWLVRRGHCDTNPWHGQFLKAERGVAKPKRPYTEAELLRLLKADPVELLGEANGGAISDLVRLGLIVSLGVL
ncbi:MAG: DUF6538 domain-containing protein [Pseudomonadota bacterium]